jgi:hypothetical protein
MVLRSETDIRRLAAATVMDLAKQWRRDLQAGGLCSASVARESSFGRRRKKASLLLVEFLEIILGEYLVRQIAQLHASILENGLFAAAQRVFHDQSGRPLSALHGLEVLVLAGLQQTIGE